MVNKQTTKERILLKPLYSLFFVSEKGTTEISAESVRIELVGEKAFGLSCLPQAWTLPFIVVSDELLSLYRKKPKASREELLKSWSKQIIAAALSVGVENQDAIIVRSSGYSEGLEERGKFYSEEGLLNSLLQPLAVCLEKLVADIDLNKYKIPLVIQKYISPISAKGHLSNERRCYEENRDWLGEFEDIKTRMRGSFQINLRNWRKKIVTGNLVDKTLACNLSAHVSEVLKIPATWVYEQKLRIHFEWIWDGKTIYLVQADHEHDVNGVNPTQTYKSRSNLLSVFAPKCLKKINQEHAIRYSKIRNVFTYRKLGLPTTTLYVLDNKSVLDDLASGRVASELEADVRNLIKGSLVIRMDIATQDAKKRQLLPRTQEVRELGSALEWLKKESAEMRKYNIQDDFVFIFHNFVPATTSAFAYAAPGERKVPIEALWGLPEGIYYNAHDKYIVDTKTPLSEELEYDKIDRFTISEKRNYKHFFVAPDEIGRWTSKILKPPYDWGRSIQKQEWIKEIALESRRIAEAEGMSLSIMWLIDVSSEDYPRKVLPWYHEYYDPAITSRKPTHRTKTPFDKSLEIKTSDDIEKLRQEAKKSHSSVRRIRIQPREERLLRSKDTLRLIGELSQKIGAIILLEGGVLSHAYYQLVQTNAIVEVLYPFRDVEDKQEFRKLVRDKVPSNIEHGGEIVNKAQLSGESLLRALREKLIEESFEVLDSIDQDSIVNELADVREIIDGILSHIGVSESKLQQKQKQKRNKTGGFKKGVVLLETRNPLPTKKDLGSSDTLFDNSSSVDTRKRPPIDDRTVIELGHKIDKQSDRREHEPATELKLRLLIPIVRDNWTAKTPERVIDLDSKSGIRAKITGTRLGSNLQLELSIFTQQKQLTLFDLKENSH